MQSPSSKHILWFMLVMQTVLLGRAPEARAAELKSDMSIKEFEYEIADNPRAVNEWARKMFSTMDKAKAPDQSAKVLAALILSAIQIGEDKGNLIAQYKKDIDDALSLTKQIRLWQEYDIFQSLWNQNRFAKDFDTYIVEDLKLLSFLFKSAPIDVALIRLTQIANALSQHDRRAAARKYANQAKLILNENPQISDFQRQSINVTIASILIDDPDTEKMAEEMLEDSTKFFKKSGRRHELALTSYNYASTIIFQRAERKSIGELNKAIGYLELASAASHEIDDTVTGGQAKAVIAHAMNRLGKHAQAETLALEALDILRDRSDVGTVSASIAAATAEIELKKYAAAKDNLAKAEELSDQSTAIPLILRVELKKMLSQLAFANKSFDKAFRYQIEYYYLDNDLNRRSKKNAVRSKSDLALQTEEERLSSSNKTDFFQSYGLLLAVSSILMAMGGSILLYRKNSRIKQLETDFETQTLQRSFHPKLVEEFMLGRTQLDESTQVKLVTILFADLVDFSSLTEKLGVERISQLLNQYFSKMSDIVFEHEGMLDKFLGPGFMVVFGVPHTMAGKEQSIRALHCAVEMMQKLSELNAEWRRTLGHTVEMRIGLCQGDATVGSFGTESRQDYTAIGATVQIASRIRDRAEAGKIFVSESIAHFFAEDCEKVTDLFLRKSPNPIPVFQYPWQLEAATTLVDAAV